MIDYEKRNAQIIHCAIGPFADKRSEYPQENRQAEYQHRQHFFMLDGAYFVQPLAQVIFGDSQIDILKRKYLEQNKPCAW